MDNDQPRAVLHADALLSSMRAQADETSSTEARRGLMMITNQETIDQLLRRLKLQEAADCGAPAPDEIAERAKVVRAIRVDERGVAKPEVVFGRTRAAALRRAEEKADEEADT